MPTVEKIIQICRPYVAPDSNNNIYFLIEHASMPDLVKKLEKSRWAWCNLFQGMREETAISVAPVLFSIEVMANDIRQTSILEWICKNNTSESSLIMLASPLSLTDLANRLTVRLEAKISEGIDVLLRYFDPRVFESLCKSLSVLKKNNFLSTATCWWYTDRTGILREEKAIFSELDMLDVTLRLDDTEVDKLIEHGEIDQLNSLLLELASSLYAPLSIIERYNFLEHEISMARENRMTGLNDIAMLCIKHLKK